MPRTLLQLNLIRSWWITLLFSLLAMVPPSLKRRRDTDKGGALPARLFQSLPLGVMIAEGVLGHILEALVNLCYWLNLGFSVLEWIYFEYAEVVGAGAAEVRPHPLLLERFHVKPVWGIVNANSGFVYLEASWEWSWSCFFDCRHVSKSLLLCLFRNSFFFSALCRLRLKISLDMLLELPWKLQS